MDGCIYDTSDCYHDCQGCPNERTNEDELEMWWHTDYWDGPLTGMAKYNGEWVWFNCTTEIDLAERTFALYRLTEKQIESQTKQYIHFRNCVGTNCDHHPDLQEWPHEPTDEQKFKNFYEKTWKKLNLTPNNKIDEVHWSQFKYWGRNS